jgi:hypothetical protein
MWRCTPVGNRTTSSQASGRSVGRAQTTMRGVMSEMDGGRNECDCPAVTRKKGKKGKKKVCL